ncbi:hypothetical protein EJ08DRAFT_736745 [Tothia fuscella]|uniref:DUF7730 domain-containing protein n=1 Tax=Tothia fuscella TaxID=1048955 RepID=A0A9P4NL26_9PEZI|nr:hypothetical protein EJ08DRAFT_736745 [Tothia fuscella]
MSSPFPLMKLPSELRTQVYENVLAELSNLAQAKRAVISQLTGTDSSSYAVPNDACSCPFAVLLSTRPYEILPRDQGQPHFRLPFALDAAHKDAIALLSTCKQIDQEFNEMYYSRLTFVVNETDLYAPFADFLGNMTPEHRKHVKHLHIYDEIISEQSRRFIWGRSFESFHTHQCTSTHSDKHDNKVDSSYTKVLDHLYNTEWGLHSDSKLTIETGLHEILAGLEDERKLGWASGRNLLFAFKRGEGGWVAGQD